ncbi:MAG: hypothetical protein FJX80_08615 [Bacteroidetes bacterium]|nr:hypothetical protein [Bacteroidota bacterium]
MRNSTPHHKPASPASLASPASPASPANPASSDSPAGPASPTNTARKAQAPRAWTVHACGVGSAGPDRPRRHGIFFAWPGSLTWSGGGLTLVSAPPGQNGARRANTGQNGAKRGKTGQKRGKTQAWI